MANCTNYKQHATWAEMVLSPDFDVRDHVADDGGWFTHFLCEAERRDSRGMGGSSFRDWVAGLYQDGVFVFARNYRVGILLASDPTATPRRGCQDSCAHGSPQPTLDRGGRWVSIAFEGWPEVIRENAFSTANRILKDAAQLILNHCNVIAAEAEKNAQEAENKTQAMIAAWQGVGAPY